MGDVAVNSGEGFPKTIMKRKIMDIVLQLSSPLLTYYLSTTCLLLVQFITTMDTEESDHVRLL